MTKDESITGIVTLSTGSWYQVLLADKSVVSARLKGKLRLKGFKSTNPVSVGDEVALEFESSGDALISEVKPRRNYIVRKSNNLSKQTQVIAANIDLAVIVATIALPRTSTGFIDRFLLTAEAYHIPVIIAFNKSDLFEGSPELTEVLTRYREIYEGIGYKTCLVSAERKQGIEELRAMLQGKRVLFSGHSGVGKSTLLNSLAPQLQRKTGDISGYSLKGKHTTTFAEMFEAWEDTYIIDTPGIKDFGIVDLKPEELAHYFREMRPLIGSCKFSNCLHVNEPSCAIIEAVEKGEIFPERYYNYLSILRNEDIHH